MLPMANTGNMHKRIQAKSPRNPLDMPPASISPNPMQSQDKTHGKSKPIQQQFRIIVNSSGNE